MFYVNCNTVSRIYISTYNLIQLNTIEKLINQLLRSTFKISEDISPK
jgi:hypothetical protein